VNEVSHIFDRALLRRRRDRAAPNFGDFDFLQRRVGEMTADCLSDIRRQFPMALELGCRTGQMAKILQGRSGIEILVQSDLSEAMALRARDRTSGLAIAADEEALPFAEQSFDLVISCLALHWVNDLPGALIQIRRALKPDGLFLAAFLGGATLAELRAALLDAETELEGGASPRVSPFADVRDGGDLLLRAGFALTVANTETLEVSYQGPAALMADLRGMGETNAVMQRRRSFTRKTTLARALALYQERHGDEDGRIPATFEIIVLTGWAPGPDQSQALAPGSGQVSLTKVLGDGAGKLRP
jgi:NADH dehydrogenase [ubiquinone] 1 alpha subcomplex assembly factor 5